MTHLCLASDLTCLLKDIHGYRTLSMATEKYQLRSLAFSFQYRNNSIDGDQIDDKRFCVEHLLRIVLGAFPNRKSFRFFLASLFADQIRVTYIFQRSQFCGYQMHNNVN